MAVRNAGLLSAAVVAAGLVCIGCGRIGFTVDSDATANRDGATLDGSARGPWRFVQVQSISNGSGSGSETLSLAVPLVPTIAGDLLIVAVECVPSTMLSVTDNAPGGTSTFTAIPGSLATFSSPSDSTEFWYAPSVKGGATAATAATPSKSMISVVVWEFATAQPATVDTVAQLTNQAASPNPMSPPVTTQDAGELVVASAVSAGDVSMINAGNEFTDDAMANDNGWAHITSKMAPAGSHQAVWDSNSAVYSSNAVAFHVGE